MSYGGVTGVQRKLFGVRLPFVFPSPSALRRAGRQRKKAGGLRSIGTTLVSVPIEEDAKMMGKRLLSLAMALAAVMANAADTTSEKLPVRRVVLYKNGVGYFEHAGRVNGAQELKIDFTSSQLNDVLKSLTVLDLDGGKISGVGYNSVAPIAQQLKALSLPLDESTTLAGFLGALRGTRVEVRSGAAVTAGRLLSVEEKTIHKGKES